MKSIRMSSLLAVASMAALAASAAAAVANVPAVRPSTPNTKAGRRMVSPGVDFYPHKVSKEHEEWNRQVELKKAAKKAANFQKRHGLTWADGTPCNPPPALQPEPTAVSTFQTGDEAQRAIDSTPLGGSIG